MVEIVIIDTGYKLDLLDTSINYVRQVGDIADFTKINDSYSWQFKIPKTSENRNALDGLGIVGSESTKPYDFVDVQLLYDGASIVNNGKLVITESNETEYKAHIKNGAIDFYDAIGSDTIIDLDLSEVAHIKTTTAIRDTLNASRQNYKYLIAWYGYPLSGEVNNATNTDSNGLLPFINFKYLVSKIEERYGWEIKGLDGFLNKTYLSTKANEEDGEPYLVADFNFEEITNTNPYFRIILDPINANSNFVSYDSTSVTIQDTGNYSIHVNASFWIETDEGIQYPNLRIYVNNTAYGNYSYPRNGVVNLDLNVGDVIYLQFFDNTSGGVVQFYNDGSYLKIVRENSEYVDFSTLLGSLKITDVLKEIFIRNTSTLYFDYENKIITAQDITKRLGAEHQDLSEFYVNRINEKYAYSSYAQENLLKHKYNDNESDYDDGIVFVGNRNLPQEKTLYQSFGYTKEDRGVIFKSLNENIRVDYLKSFEIENSEDSEEIKYKPLKDRFFIAEFDYVQASSIAVNGQLSVGLPWANMERTAYRNVVGGWGDMRKILNESKIIKVKLRMSSFDFASIDLSKTIYLEQEKAYFIINKLSLKKDKDIEAEFVKINNYKPTPKKVIRPNS